MAIWYRLEKYRIVISESDRPEVLAVKISAAFTDGTTRMRTPWIDFKQSEVGILRSSVVYKLTSTDSR